MQSNESFYALVGKMESDSSRRVFEARRMRPPSIYAPEKSELWGFADKEVELILCKSRVVERRNLSKKIKKLKLNLLPSHVTAPKQTTEDNEDKKNDDEKKTEEKEVLFVLADMTSFIKY